MIIYLFVFVMSVLLLNVADKLYYNNKFYILFFLLAVFCPVALAAYRDCYVGQDTLSYLKLFEDACSSNTFFQYIMYNARIEKGFLLITYVISKNTNDPIIFLGFCHFLIILPAYISFLKLQKYLVPALSAMIFLLLFYNESLNLTRQYISISFILLSVPYWIDRKYVKATICVLIATSFHTTALLGMLFPMYRMMFSKYPLKKNLSLYIISILLISFIALNFSRWGLLAFLREDVSVQYEKYLNGVDSGMSVSTSTLIVYLCVLIILMISVYRTKTDDSLMSTFSIIAVFALLTVFLSPIARPLYRLSLDFSAYCCISIPLLYAPYKKKNLFTCHRSTSTLCIFIMLILSYWIFSVVIKGSNNTYPYTSRIIDVWLY